MNINQINNIERKTTNLYPMQLCDIQESHMTIFVLNTMIIGKHNEMFFYYYHFPRSLESAHPPWQWLLVAFSKG